MRLKRFAAVDLPAAGRSALDRILLGEDEPERQGDARTVPQLIAAAQEAYFRGRYRRGLEDSARALAQDRRQVDAWVGQVRILVDAGAYGPAVYWAEKGRHHFIDSMEMACAHGLALAFAGRTDEARDLINVPVSRDETSMVWLLRGEVLLRMKTNLLQRLFAPHKSIGRMGAFFCFMKALAPAQDHAFLNQRIGLAYLLAADLRPARMHLEASLAAVGDNPLTRLGIAECCRMGREYDAALDHVKRAIAGNPELDAAFELLEWLHRPAAKWSRIFNSKQRRERS